MTTRQTIGLPGLVRVPLEELQPDEARALLRSEMGEARASDAQLDAIAERCGWLPLALRAAGRFLAEYEGWPIEGYLTDLADEKKRLRRLRPEDDPSLDVAAVLSFSARQLHRDDPELALRWQQLAVFPVGFDVAAGAAVWDVAPGEVREALARLHRRSMVLPERGHKDRWRLHDLMRDVAQLPLDGQDPAALAARLEAARVRHARHYCRLLATAGELYSEGSEAGLALYDCEQRNIAVGQAWASAHIDEDRRAAICAANYAGSASMILMLRMHPRERLTWHEAQRVACAKLGVRRGECAALNMMGVALVQLAELQQGVNCLRQSLRIAREIGAREAEGSALCNLGLAYVHLGEAQNSIEQLGECLQIARDLGNTQQEANALGGPGSAWLLLDYPLQALYYHKQRLALARSTGDRKGEGNAFGNIGSAWLRIGDRIGEGNGLLYSALALDQLGERAEAVRRAREALAIFEAIGAKHLVEQARAQLAEWGADDTPG